jgi:hypothetical protein
MESGECCALFNIVERSMMYLKMKTFRIYVSDDVYFDASEIEALSLNLTGLNMIEQDFFELLNISEQHFTVKDDLINDISVNLNENMIGFDTDLIEGIIEKIESLSVPEIQKLYLALYKAKDLLNLTEFINVDSK